MRTLTLPSGDGLAVLGQGTWGMGERAAKRDAEITALKHGIDRGLTLIDTAEMYGDGGAEEVIKQAVAGRRDEAFIVSKVFPHNASRHGAVEACQRSLDRLGTDRIDLYLLHWRGSVRLEDTLEAFEQLRSDGKIRHFGVSNFDTRDITDLSEQPSAAAVATNQVLYNLARRGPEYELLPLCRERGLPVMAYSPIEQGRILGHDTLRQIAEQRGVSAARVALAWVLHQPEVCAIPKASTTEHVDENAAALDLELSADELAELDHAFPPPQAATPLEIL